MYVFRPLLVLASAGLLLAGCATVLTGHSDYDKKFDFARFKSFYWMYPESSAAAEAASPGISALNLRRIREAVQADLQAKGYTLADSRQSADFVVSFSVGTRDKLEVDTLPAYYRGPWYWHPYYWADAGVYARTYTEGTLGIDIFDQRSGTPVWSGWVRKRVLQSDRDNPEPVIHKAVAAVLAHFPPSAAAGK
jgi:hypothetical protein